VGGTAYPRPVSKVDAQRAMKAARNARTPAATPVAPAEPGTASAPARRAAGASVTPGAAPGAPAAATVTPGTDVCGHRSMAGKECRRPAGHAEKSHRYS